MWNFGMSPESMSSNFMSEKLGIQNSTNWNTIMFLYNCVHEYLHVHTCEQSAAYIFQASFSSITI